MNFSIKNSKALQFVLLLVAFFVLNALITPSESNYLWRLPPLLSSLPTLINDAVQFIMFDWMPIQVYDPSIQEFEEKALFREITRSISNGFLFVITFIREIFLGGPKTIVAFTSWDFVSENSWATWPALPWTVVSGWAIVLGFKLQGIRLALLAAVSTTYIGVFGQWEPSMQTLSFVLIAAPVSVLLGLALGIWGYKNKLVETALNPLLNVAQTMPHYSYLVPVIVLFGVGDQAAAIATIFFATPPMVRLTLLGLKNIPPEIVDAGMMNGCTQYQLLSKVQIPTARRDILIGVNQVVMQCLAMTVIASFIGAQGLGSNLMIALNSLKIGSGLEIGICIVLIAVMLDKMSLAWANKQIDYFSDQGFWDRHKYLIICALILLIGIFFAYLGKSFFKENFNYLYIIPHNKGITTAPFWQAAVDWIWDTFFFSLKSFNEFLIINILVPMKEAYLGMPVAATFLLVMGTAFILAGIRSAFIVAGFLLFIAFSEYWDRALITAYMTSFAVIVAAVLGITVGSLCAQNNRATKVILFICDFFQTFPSFIYLIPVIMLFGITDTSVIIAAIVYALVPATRYTVEGLRNVPSVLRDAGSMMGVSKMQQWLSIDLPLAFPHIMLGVNQTVVFSLFMVIIGAFIGTTDLGQLILKAISDSRGTGIGLTLGLCVAFIGLAVDQILRTWANDRKKALGLE
ncbi:MAG: glycine betaine/proline transport system permease protein [Candidatus Azotimanducaceae bacterium]|jgi:glycine betaine/proline transport system permease protein